MPHTKATLLQMNADPKLGLNWILNIEHIKDTEEANLHASWDASLHSGRFYVALPVGYVITAADRTKYNLM
jgi:hypothetical protein